jgi:hypothetical protein
MCLGSSRDSDHGIINRAFRCSASHLVISTADRERSGIRRRPKDRNRVGSRKRSCGHCDYTHLPRIYDFIAAKPAWPNYLV